MTKTKCYLSIKKLFFQAEDVAEVIEQLPSKHKTLSLNPSLPHPPKWFFFINYISYEFSLMIIFLLEIRNRVCFLKYSTSFSKLWHLYG
jgi:hypothetical protein